jgi:hypothetical protein
MAWSWDYDYYWRTFWFMDVESEIHASIYSDAERQPGRYRNHVDALDALHTNRTTSTHTDHILS